MGGDVLCVMQNQIGGQSSKHPMCALRTGHNWGSREQLLVHQSEVGVG